MRRLILAAVAALAAACSPQAEQEIKTAEAAGGVDTSPLAQPPTPMPAPEPLVMDQTYCWFNADARVTEGLAITFDGTTASGEHFGVVHDEENAYFTAFSTTLTEGVSSDGEVWTFAALTEVDGDTQEAEDSWRLNAASAGLAAFEDHAMRRADCDGLETEVYGPPIEVE